MYMESINIWLTLFVLDESCSSSCDAPSSDDSPSPDESDILTVHYFDCPSAYKNEKLLLEIQNKIDSSITMQTRLFLLDIAGQPTEKQSGIRWDHFEETDGLVDSDFIIEKEYFVQRKENLLRNGTDVHMRYEGAYAYDCEDQSEYRSQERHYTATHRMRVGSSLSTDIGQLLLTRDGCPGDMCVVSDDGTSLSVHRDVLCARSPVLEAMMERDTKVRQTDQIHFSDLSRATIEQFILFMYTGKLENEHQIDINTLVWLYAIGDKYGVVSLKKRCSILLRSRLSIENTCDFLEFSELFSDRELRGQALKVLSKRTEILVSEDWLKLSHGREKMAKEVLNEVRLLRKKS